MMTRTATALLVAAALATLSSAPTLAREFGLPADYVLSLETGERCHRAVLGLFARATKDEALKLEMANFSNEPPEDVTVDDMVAHLETESPLASRLMEGAGCSVRDYMTFSLAALEAAFVLYAREAGQPDTAPDGVPPANVTFLEKNQARLEAMGIELEEAQAAAGIERTPE